MQNWKNCSEMAYHRLHSVQKLKRVICRSTSWQSHLYLLYIHIYTVHQKCMFFNTQDNAITQDKTRHRASTSMYSLTFCVRVMSPESHHWKPAVQATTVMLRTPPVDSQLPASQARPLPIYGMQFWECPRHPLVTGQQRAHTPPSVRTMSSYHRIDASL